MALKFKLSVAFAVLFFLNTSAKSVVHPSDSLPSKENKKSYSATLITVGTVPKAAKEASGLEITNGKHFWTHNDDGIPVLFCLDSAGTLLRTLHLNHTNSGWEDLAQDEKNSLYIGAFGNNKNDKRINRIYKISNPDSIRSSVYQGEIIEFSFQDQKAFPPPPSQMNFDMDAFFCVNDTLFLFTKNRTKPFNGYTKIYKIPTTAGKYIVSPYDSIYLGAGPMMEYWVTSADISPRKETVALLSHDKMWLIKNFRGTKFSTGKITEVSLNHFTHKSGICFKNDSVIYIVDELELGFLGGKLYKLDLKQLKH